LALEVVLSNLKDQSPEEILGKLDLGGAGLDSGKARTESIVACIDYSHSNLASDIQGLTDCLAPFTGVIHEGILKPYTERLKAQPALEHLPFERWGEVIQATQDWGLVRPHREAKGFLELQPTLPYFLRVRLASEERRAAREAIEIAFHETYEGAGSAIANLLGSKDAGEKAQGLIVAKLEEENLLAALRIALNRRASFLGPTSALIASLDATHASERQLRLMEWILGHKDLYNGELIEGDAGDGFLVTLERKAAVLLKLSRPEDARQTYLKELEMHRLRERLAQRKRLRASAGILHKLAEVARRSHDRADAEKLLSRVLRIRVRLDELPSQAEIFLQLGMLAHEAGNLARAETCHKRALEIFSECGDMENRKKCCLELARISDELGNLPDQIEYYKKIVGEQPRLSA